MVMIAEKAVDQWYFGCLAGLGDCLLLLREHRALKCSLAKNKSKTTKTPAKSPNNRPAPPQKHSVLHWMFANTVLLPWVPVAEGLALFAWILCGMRSLGWREGSGEAKLLKVSPYRAWPCRGSVWWVMAWDSTICSISFMLVVSISVT